MSLERGRIAEVWASGGQGGRAGSGYLVSERHVLTAAHVVEPSAGSADGVCQVRCLDQPEWFDARIAWRHRAFDLALLEMREASGQAVSPVRFGRVIGTRSVACTAVGFPDAQARPTGDRESEQLDGEIRPLATAKADRLTVHVRGSTPRDFGTGRTLWAGMSGAAVFAEGVLVGVVEFDPANFGTDRLVATPISLVASDPEALPVFARADIDLQLEDIPAVPGLNVWTGRRVRTTRGSPSLLLRSDRATVPFRGRQAEIDGLLEWCTSASPLVHLLVGPAGTGKTRLAGEVCRRLAERGWRTGFVEDKALDDLVKRVSELGQPALLAIDYAETRAGLHDLLARMVDVTPQPRLRVLLLARSAGDWWQALQGASAQMEQVLFGTQVQLLGAVDTSAIDRAASYVEATHAFVSEQGMSPRVVAAPDLSKPEFEAILFVHMAALDAVGTPDDPAPGPSATGSMPVLEAMRRREMRYWSRSARVKGLLHADIVLERAVAIATLVGADDEDEAAAVLLRVPDLKGPSQEEQRRALARWYRDLYPSTEWLGPVQPDALAEEIAAHVLADTPGLARTAFRDLPPARAQRALTILDRSARRRPEMERALEEVLGSDLEGLASSAIAVAVQTGDPIGRLLAQVLDATPDAALPLPDLIEQIPAQTVALREVAARLASAAVVNARTSDSQADLAGSLNNLSVRLANLGRREDALAAIHEAVDIYRQLAAARPDAFRPDLAGSLNNLSGRLANLGQREDALAAIREAVAIRRELAAARPDAFRPDLASALNNLSNQLSDLGQREDALAAIHEAVDVYRQLAAARPDAFRPDLAMALNNLSGSLADLGQREDALAAIHEAVAIRRELAAARPDAFRPDLASALNNLSNGLSNLGQREDALAASQEAVAIRRELAAARPDAFRPNLAMSLHNLSNRLANLGQREDALAASQEAVAICRQLAAARPDAFRPNLAMALNNLSTGLSNLGQREDALAAIQEAVDVYRQLAAARPDAFRPDLALALNNLSLRLADLGQREDALAASQEAVDVYRQLAAARPDAFRPNLAMSLNNLSNGLSNLGQREDALAVIREAVDVYRRLAAARPDAFRPDLAGSLNNLSTGLSNLGQREDALAVIREAVDVYRQLAAARPDAFRPDLAGSLNNLSNRLADLGRREAALAAILEAVDVYRQLAASRPGLFQDQLTTALSLVRALSSQSSGAEDDAHGGQTVPT